MNAKITGIAAKKIIVVPCIVVNWLNESADKNVLIRKQRAESGSRMASSPPTRKKKPPANKYKIRDFLMIDCCKPIHQARCIFLLDESEPTY